MRLTDQQVAVLAFERAWWRRPGSKEQAIHEEFELSGTRYHQLLNALLDDPAALEHDPLLVHRLRRVRGQRLTRRGAA